MKDYPPLIISIIFLAVNLLVFSDLFAPLNKEPLQVHEGMCLLFTDNSGFKVLELKKEYAKVISFGVDSMKFYEYSQQYVLLRNLQRYEQVSCPEEVLK